MDAEEEKRCRQEEELYPAGDIHSVERCLLEMWLLYARERDRGHFKEPLVPEFERKLKKLVQTSRPWSSRLKRVISVLWRKVQRMLPSQEEVEAFMSSSVSTLLTSLDRPEDTGVCVELLWRMGDFSAQEECPQEVSMRRLLAGFPFFTSDEVLQMAAENQCPPVVIVALTGGEEDTKDECRMQGYTLARLSRSTRHLSPQKIRQAFQEAEAEQKREREDTRKTSLQVVHQAKQTVDAAKHQDHKHEALQRRIAKARLLASFRGETDT